MFTTSFAAHSVKYAVAGIRRSALVSAMVAVGGLGLSTTTIAAATTADDPDSLFDLTALPFLTLSSTTWIAVVALLVISAYVYQQLQLDVLRWLMRKEDERRFRRFWQWRVDRHRRKWHQLNEEIATGAGRSPAQRRRLKRRRSEYPRNVDKVRSTRLANKLVRAEEGPWLGVEADLELVGPPLLNLLSPEERAAINEPRDELDTFVGLVLALWLTTAVSSIGAAALAVSKMDGGAAAFLVALAVVSAIGAVGFHEKALLAAAGYQEGLDITFLLYRHRLLDHLDLGRPERLADEAARFKDAEHLIKRNRSRRELGFAGDEADKDPDRDIEFRRP